MIKKLFIFTVGSAVGVLIGSNVGYQLAKQEEQARKSREVQDPTPDINLNIPSQGV